jgi:uncharacterized protein
MKPFQLLVKPAAGDCNLACDYCFYRRTTPELYPAEPRHRMDRETMARVVKDLLSYRFPETVFCWQGGEPTLMGLDWFEAVIAEEMKHGRGGQVVGNAFQTNGLLVNEDWARWFARHQVVVGLSLDGPREVHDHFRKNAAGTGTFDRVIAAAELMMDHGVAMNVLCVVNRVSQDRGREIYRFFRAQGFNYIQFIPCLETDPATGEVLPFSATPEGLARFYGDVFAEYRREGPDRVSERNLDAVLSLHLHGRPGLCIFEKKCGAYLVVEWNGDVYPCDFFVEKKWRLGNVRDQRLAEFFAHPKMKKFAAQKGKTAAECGPCRRRDWCHGGCLKDRLPARADAPGQSRFCAAYQALFADTDADMKKWARALKEETSSK